MNNLHIIFTFSIIFLSIFLISVFAEIPTYSLNSTNSTTAGRPAEFRLKWNNDVGLSGYIFSFSNCTFAFNLDNTTTVKLQNPENETMEDVDINYDTGTGYPGHYRSLIKFNMSSLPSNLTIADAKLYLYAYGVYSGWDGDVNVYRINDQTWTEDDTVSVLWDLRDNRTNYSTFSSKWTTLDWYWVNVTDALITDYETGNDNVSFWLEDPDYNSSDANNKNNPANSFMKIGYRTYEDDRYVGLRTKEGVAIYRPYLNITYAPAEPSYSNDTWTSMSGTENWSNVTKVVNSTLGCTIRWKVYANNTNSTWNTSQTYSFVTTDNESPTWNETTGYLGSNTTTPYEGGAVELYSMLKDAFALDWAWLSTNETGTWINYSSYWNLGSGKTFNAGVTQYLGTITAFSSGGRVLAAYRDQSNSGYGTLVVLNETGHVVTGETVFSGVQTSYVSTGKAHDGNVSIVYRGLNSYGYINVRNSTGGSVCSGTVQSANIQYLVVSRINNTHMIVAYQDVGSSNDGTAVVVNSTCDVVTSERVFETGSARNYKAVQLSNGNVIIAYVETTGPAIKAVVLNSSGHAPYGAKTVLSTSSVSGQIGIAPSSNGQSLIVFANQSNSNYGTVAILNSSGHVQSSKVFNQQATVDMDIANLSNDNFVITYVDSDGSGKVLIVNSTGDTIVSASMFNPFATNYTHVVESSTTNITIAFVNDSSYGIATYIAPTVYGSPKQLSGSDWTWANFTWQNSSVSRNTSVAWKVFFNDSSGNENVTDEKTLTITGETSPPTWSLNTSQTPATYSSSNLSQFNVTWQDNVAVNTVLIEISNSSSVVVDNASMTNSYGGSIYNYSVVLPAGSFTWKSYANDSYGNWNVTDNWSFTISKASSQIHLALNGTESNKTYTYPDFVNATAWIQTPSGANGTLFRNGTVLGNPRTLTNLTYHYNNNDSSSAYSARGFRVNFTSIGSFQNTDICSVRWKINKNGCNGPCSSGISVLLKVNSNNIANLTGGNHSTSGWYEWNTSCSNFDSSYNLVSLSVIDAMGGDPNCNLCFAQETYPLDGLLDSVQANNGVWGDNRTDRDFAFELYVYKDREMDEQIRLGVGAYNYSFNYSGDQNYSSNETWYLATISKKNANVRVYPATQTINYSQPVNQYCVDDAELVDCAIFRDGQLMTNNSQIILEAGTYNYTANITDVANHTNYQNTTILTVTVTNTTTGTYTNNSVSTTADTTETINATTSSNTTISLEIVTAANVSNSTISITEYNSTPPNATSITSIGIYGIDKSFDISLGSGLSSNLVWAMVNISYNESEVTAAGLDESSLGLYRFNTTSSSWQSATPGGVNIVSNYVWANLTSFSSYSLGGLKTNGQACSADANCYSGYCVHSVCRATSTYCGDGYCDSGETSSSCSADCLTTSSTGGGGGWVATAEEEEAAEEEEEEAGEELCVESWSCTDWSDCSNGVQTRTCTDANACGTTATRPSESQECVPLVTPEAAPAEPTIPLGVGIGLVAIIIFSAVMIFLILRKKRLKHKRKQNMRSVL